MKGNDQIIAKLNFVLADELTAISQYMVHAEMCANWGYKKLAEVTEKRAIDEMKHAEKHISRIIFLEGRPVVSNLNPIHIENDVKSQLEADHAAEAGAVVAYNEAIHLCDQLGDAGTRELFEDVLGDEEDHIDFVESQLDQIAQMGLANYLATLVED
jgi:bacterioferritin